MFYNDWDDHRNRYVVEFGGVVMGPNCHHILRIGHIPTYQTKAKLRTMVPFEIRSRTIANSLSHYSPAYLQFSTSFYSTDLSFSDPNPNL